LAAGSAEFNLERACLLDLGRILGGHFGSDSELEPDSSLGGTPDGIILSTHLDIFF